MGIVWVRPERPVLVGDTDAGVGYLDAPALDAGTLFAAVDDALADMPAEAILTVFTDDPAEAGRGVHAGLTEPPLHPRLLPKTCAAIFVIVVGMTTTPCGDC